jgi:mannose-6-phosphate isomerase
MRPLRIVPDLRERVWGGTRLSPRGPAAAGPPAPGALPIGEAWLAGPSSRVLDGPAAGASLDELAASLGSRLTGSDAREPGRFPLLAKIIDASEWLSVQVHPDDDQARRLEGPAAVGKTEAWCVLDAAPGAGILLGVRPGVPPERVGQAIREGGLADLLERREVRRGESYLVPAGTLHAIGPGVLVYEIQQPSDITYRCDDWGRPPTPARPIHVAQSLECMRPEPWRGARRSISGATARGLLVRSVHFVLEYLRPAAGELAPCHPAMASLHLLTSVTGQVVVCGDGWEARLALFETLVVPADAGEYRVTDAGGADGATQDPIVLLARLPSPNEREAAGEDVADVDPA